MADIKTSHINIVSGAKKKIEEMKGSKA